MSSKSKKKRAGGKQRTRPPVAHAASASGETAAVERPTPHDSYGRTPARVSRALMERFPESGVELTAENLPVLNAFNEFLEVERRASRRRFRGMFWLFLILLLAALTSALLVGRIVVRQMQAELVAERELAEAERQQMAGAISLVATDAADTLHRELNVRDQAVRYTYRTLTDHIAGQTNAVIELLETMAILEQEIDALENSIRELSQRERGAPATAPYIAAGRPPSGLDSELEMQIEQDFAELRRWARTQREILGQTPEADGLPEQRQDRDNDDIAPSSPLTIQTPVGESVPWRL